MLFKCLMLDNRKSYNRPFHLFFIIRFILIYFSSFSVQPILFCKIVGRSINTFVQTNSFVQQHHSSLVNIVNDLGSFVNKIFENSERL